MRRVALVSVVVGTIGFLAETPRGQGTGDVEGSQTESVTRKRLAALYARFPELLALTPPEQSYREACKSSCDQSLWPEAERERSQRSREMDVVADQMHAVVDDFIARAVEPGVVDRQVVEASLTRVLPGEFDEDALPAAFVDETSGNRRLAISYTFGKGGWHGEGATSVALRVYEAVDGRFTISGAADRDMDGYSGVSVKALPAPVVGQMFFLLSGLLTGANGPNNRMRIYAYDGDQFRTVWAPENVWGRFDVDVYEGGFTVRGDYYQESRSRYDVYSLTVDGVRRVLP